MFSLIYFLLFISLALIVFFLQRTIKQLPSHLPQTKVFNQIKIFLLIIASLSFICLIGNLCHLLIFSSFWIPLSLLCIVLVGSMLFGFKLAHALTK